MSNLKPLILHAHTTGPNPIKIGIAMEYLHVPYEIKLWEFGPNDTNGVKGKAFHAINPNGRVPALEDPNTGVVSWESGACLNYLRRVYDKPKGSSGETVLGPVAGSGEQGIVDLEKWEYFLLSTLGPMTGQVNWFRHYHDSKNEDALNRYVAQTERCYGVLDEQLALSKKGSGKALTIIPGKFTAADIHFEPWVRQHKFAGIPLDKYPNIQAWLSETAERQEVKTAYTKLQNAAKAGQSSS